jgi:arsenate reductase
MALPQSDRELVLLHNPRCSKSRAALALLEERGVSFVVRRYLDDPLSKPELDELARRLGRPPREWIRSKEAAYADAGLSEHSAADELTSAMAAAPILMERPVLIRGGRAAVGRPPETILSLLDA